MAKVRLYAVCTRMPGRMYLDRFDERSRNASALILATAVHYHIDECFVERYWISRVTTKRHTHVRIRA